MVQHHSRQQVISNTERYIKAAAVTTGLTDTVYLVRPTWIPTANHWVINQDNGISACY